MRSSRAIVVGAIIGALAGACTLAGSREPSRDEVLQGILPSAVQIVVEQQEGRRVRAASGVVLGAQSLDQHPACFVLTAGHTVTGIAGQKGIYVAFGRHRGTVTKAAATVVAYHDAPDLDLALLKTDSTSCAPARAAGPPILGEAVWVVGFPWGRHMTLASGIVSQINVDDGREDGETASQLMVDASVSYGSSGGGVYEARRGSLIGIVKGYSTARVSAHGADPPWYIDVPVPGGTFVTPLSDVRRFLAGAGYAYLIGPPPGEREGGGAAADRIR